MFSLLIGAALVGNATNQDSNKTTPNSLTGGTIGNLTYNYGETSDTFTYDYSDSWTGTESDADSTTDFYPFKVKIPYKNATFTILVVWYEVYIKDNTNPNWKLITYVANSTTNNTIDTFFSKYYTSYTLSANETYSIMALNNDTYEEVGPFNLDGYEVSVTPAYKGEQYYLKPKYAVGNVPGVYRDAIVNVVYSYDYTINSTTNINEHYEEVSNYYTVEVMDGDNYYFKYVGFQNATLTFDGTYSIQYDFDINFGYAINATFDNGTEIPTKYLPSWLVDKLGRYEYYAQGTFYAEVNYNIDAFYLAPLQGYLQAVVPRNSTSLLMSLSGGDGLDISQSNIKLAILANFNPGYIVGFKDTNGNGQLDVSFDGVEFNVTDVLTTLGIPEGASLTFTGNDYYNFTSTEKIYIDGSLVSSNTTGDEENTTYNSEKFYWGYDPSTVGAFTTNTIWNNPVDLGNYKYKFEFGIEYVDYPITWWDLEGSGSFIMDTITLKYTYTLIVDRLNGVATLSSTYQQSAVSPTVKSMVTGEGMATFMYNLALTAGDLGLGIPGVQSIPVTNVSAALPGDIPLYDVNFGGTKAQYTLDGTPYTATTNAITLLVVAGTITPNDTLEMDSSFIESPVATKLMNMKAHALGNDSFEFVASLNLFITSYPEWEGGEIIHDPEVDTYYNAVGISSGSGGEEETPAPSTNIGFDGYDVLLMGFAVIFGVMMFKRKRR